MPRRGILTDSVKTEIKRVDDVLRELRRRGMDPIKTLEQAVQDYDDQKHEETDAENP